MPGDLAYHKHAIEEDYEMKSKTSLGEGGFGQVCMAIHKATGVERACKRIRKKDVKDKSAFEREVSLQMSLDHPNICRLYDCYQDGKMYYLCMEICKGGELFDRILEAQHFGEDTVGMLAKQMLSGLLYMHCNEMAHRDLKPENYLLLKDCDVEKNHLKLIDFGMSRKFTPGKPMSTRVVTPYYVAPEVLAGKYDEKCDIWSLGVIFYILFCGSPPFYSHYEGKRGDEDIFKKIRKAKFTFEDSEWKHVSPHARKFVSDLLVLDVRKRPTAFEALEHPWVVEHMPKMKQVNLSSEAMGSMKGFRKQGKVQKAALNMVAKNVPTDKVEELSEMFLSMDANGDGMLSMDELKTGLEKSGLGEVNADLKEMMDALDADGSGRIDYSEFVAATMSKKMANSYDSIWQVFKQFDRDNSGSISKDDLAIVLSDGAMEGFDGLQGDLKDEILKLINEYDKNSDGVIDFDEFMALMQEGWNASKRTTLGDKKKAECS
jgi:calcium-dependent protein kinase